MRMQIYQFLTVPPGFRQEHLTNAPGRPNEPGCRRRLASLICYCNSFAIVIHRPHSLPGICDVRLFMQRLYRSAGSKRRADSKELGRGRLSRVGRPPPMRQMRADGQRTRPPWLRAGYQQNAGRSARIRLNFFIPPSENNNSALVRECS